MMDQAEIPADVVAAGAAVEELPPLRPLQRNAHIETDHFCDCGYNLHGQVVTRDERLGFFICRCPECGKTHPAGAATGANSLWLRRLVTVGIGIWVLAIVGVFLFGAFMIGVMQAIDLEITHSRVENWNSIPSWQREEYYISRFFGFGTAAVLGLIAPVVMWHIRRYYYLWLGLLPFASSAVVLFFWMVDSSSWSRFEINFLSQAWFALQLGVVLVVATLLGRPLARGIVLALVPPRARHLVSFLWEADGKPPPNPKSAADDPVAAKRVNS